MSQENYKLGLGQVITAISTLVTIAGFVLGYRDFIKKNGDTQISPLIRLLESFQTFGILATYFVWAVFLAIYGILLFYDRQNKLSNNGEKYRNNHSFNLFKLGGSALVVQHVTYSFDIQAPIFAIIPQWLIIIISVICAIYGFYWVIYGRVCINGLWDPHIIKYKNQKIITTGAYSKTRHPIYTGQIALTIAIFVACWNSWLIYLPVFTFIQAFRRAKLEEKSLLELSPDAYNEYIRNVPSFMHFPLVE